MTLIEVREARKVVSRQALRVALIRVRALGHHVPCSIAEVRPVWFAMLTCENADLKRLWTDGVFKRWWKINADVIAGVMRLAPEHIVPTSETPFP